MVLLSFVKSLKYSEGGCSHAAAVMLCIAAATNLMQHVELKGGTTLKLLGAAIWKKKIRKKGNRDHFLNA